MTRGGAALLAVVLLVSAPALQPRRNFVIFVADGLRRASVNAADSPALFQLRTEGVDFANSHAVYPTLTMPNAATIATGHYPGDTGQYGNNVFIGEPLFASDARARVPGSVTPNFENNRVLAEINGRYGGNFLAETSLFSIARMLGYNTAAIGKEGPTALQDLATAAEAAASTPPNRSLQALLDEALGRVLPGFIRSGKPFLLVFWCPEPDATQHNHGDGRGSLSPGINGPASRAAVRAADSALNRLHEFLKSQPGVYANTDVLVTSDHGFSTVSPRQVDREGHTTTSYSATFTYRNTSGQIEATDGLLPGGHVSIDLAHGLNLPLFDPDAQVVNANGTTSFIPVDPTIGQQTLQRRQRPLGGGLIGGSGRVRPTDAKVVVAGSSIYVPDHDAATVRRIVNVFARQDYVGGIFVHDSFGRIPGALPMSAIGMMGTALLPQPAVIVTPRAFSLNPADPLRSSIIVTGVGGIGQGNHGAFTRAETMNNMAAIGPDFKRRFVDMSPVSNADLQLTVRSLMDARMLDRGRLTGRRITEAFVSGPPNVKATSVTLQSDASDVGKRTLLMYQQIGTQHYLDQACYEAMRC
jgi:hypothetical protein